MMGPQVEPSAPAESSTTSRRRTESSKTSGWDYPPAVASPSNGKWIPRSCHWKTPQRLFTLDPNQQQQPKDFAWGDLLCAPIVVSNRYILVASDTTLMVYGNLESTPEQMNDTTVSPLTKFFLDTNEDGGSFGTDKILQIAFHEETSIVYALTVESCVYQVKLNLENKSDEENDEEKNKPKFQMMHSWITRQLGATCMITWNNSDGFDTIYVGYRNGHLEAWKVPQVYSVDPKRNFRMRGPRKALRDVKLEWDGYLFESIRTLSLMPPCNKDENFHQDLYLMAMVSVVTRAKDKDMEQPTSSMLKILDVNKIISEKKKRMEEVTTTSTSLDEENTICLEHFSIAQSRDRELIDASTVSLSKNSFLPKRIPVLDGQRANASCRMAVGNQQFSSLAFSDGTIGLFSRSGDAVGIAATQHQILLSYPAIGSGHIRVEDEKGSSADCLAVCLRGGTCYLIPVSIESSNNDNSIAVIPYPHDIEMDLSDVYVQAFCAGNLQINGTDIPILVYAWPGGVIDVYSCGLVESETSKVDEEEIFVSRAEKRCLRDLIDNEAIPLVTQILKESRDTSLLQTGEWRELFEEFGTGNISMPPSGEEISLELLCSKEYESLRRLLLSLAHVSEQ